MKLSLSECIRLGALLRPQQYGGWADGEGSCALQAAAEACGIAPRYAYHEGGVRLACDYDALKLRFSVLTPWVICEIFQRNDRDGYTREEIADYVAALEAAQASRPRLVEVPA